MSRHNAVMLGNSYTSTFILNMIQALSSYEGQKKVLEVKYDQSYTYIFFRFIS